MPDLITHAVVNALLPRRSARPHEVWAFVFGSALPDLASRAPSLFVARVIEPRLLASGPALDSWTIGLNFMHGPLGVTLLSVVLAAAWPAWSRLSASRWRLAWLLTLGAMVHLALDLGQIHLEPAYRYLWPLSLRPLQLNVFDPEISVLVWPLLLPLVLLRRRGWPPKRVEPAPD